MKNKTPEKVFNRVIEAGKRKYFINVKRDKHQNCYLTLTEIKKNENSNRNNGDLKQTIFLFPELINEFIEGLGEAINFIQDDCKQKTALKRKLYFETNLTEEADLKPLDTLVKVEQKIAEITFEDL